MEEGAARTFACLALLLADLGLAALLAALVGRWQLRRLSSSWAAHQSLRLHRWLISGLLLAALGHVLSLVVQVLTLLDAGEAPTAVAERLLADTHYGHAWLGALGGLVLLAVVSRPRASRATWSTAVGWCAVILFVWARAFASHAAQQEGATVQTSAQALHVIAVSTWLGAVVAASRVRLPAIADPAADRADSAAWALRLSTAATVALAILVTTGAFRAWHSLSSWSALLSSEYGRLLTVKLVFVLVAALLGGSSRFFVLPSLVRVLRTGATAGAPVDRFRHILVTESIVLLLALSTATLLATGDPPMGG